MMPNYMLLCLWSISLLQCCCHQHCVATILLHMTLPLQHLYYNTLSNVAFAMRLTLPLPLLTLHPYWNSVAEWSNWKTPKIIVLPVLSIMPCECWNLTATSLWPFESSALLPTSALCHLHCCQPCSTLISLWSQATTSVSPTNLLHHLTLSPSRYCWISGFP